MASLVLVVASVAVLLFAVYQLGKTNGWAEGWKEGREVWRPSLEQAWESAGFWRRAALHLGKHSAPNAAGSDQQKKEGGQ